MSHLQLSRKDKRKKNWIKVNKTANCKYTAPCLTYGNCMYAYGNLKYVKIYGITSFKPSVSEMDSSISAFGHIHCFLKDDSCKSRTERQTVCILMRRLIMSRLIWIYTFCKNICVSYSAEKVTLTCQDKLSSRKHAYIMLTPLNPTFI